MVAAAVFVDPVAADVEGVGIHVGIGVVAVARLGAEAFEVQALVAALGLVVAEGVAVGVVPADRVREALREESVSLPTLDEVRNEAERDYLVKLLRLTRGNVSQAARLASRNRTEFYKLPGRHALDPGRFRDA